MPKIQATRRSVGVQTPRLTPPSTSGFGASGAAMKNVGNAIGQFAGVFDAFSKANEKNEAADADMSLLNFQMEMDKKEAEFGQTYQGDGKNYYDQSENLFDGTANEFKQKNYGKYSPKTQQKLDRALLGLKVGHQKKSITKGTQFQNNHASLKMAEYSGTIITGMLTPENLKTRGIGIVEEAANKYFKSVDIMGASPNIKRAAKLSFIKGAAKQVQDNAPAISLLKWQERKQNEIEAAAEGKDQQIPANSTKIQKIENDPRAKETVHGRVEGYDASGIKPEAANKVKTLKIGRDGKEVAEAQGKKQTSGSLSDDQVLDTVVNKVIGYESGGNPNIKNQMGSSALGLGQFIKSTWLGMVKKYKPELMQGKTRAQILDMRRNPQLSRFMTKMYAKENMDYLKRRGIDPTPGAVYAAHQLGPDKAARIIKNPNITFRSMMSAEAYRQNPNLQGKNGAQYMAWAERKFGGKGAQVASYKKEEQPQDVASMVFSQINWDAVKKRYTAEQDQAFIQSVARGETKVSPHDSGFMKKWNKSFDQILKPDTNLLKDDNARNLVISLANNKAPMPKQVFEKIRGHIESLDPSERSKGFELLNMLEGKNPAAFNKGDNAQHLSKQLGIYRTMANFKGPEGAVKDMIHMEDRLSKMSKDELKSEKGAFLKTLNDVDFGSVLEGIHGGDVFDADDAFSPIERARMMSEFRTLAVGEFEKYGNSEYAKAAAVSMLRKRYGETNVTGANTIMKYPPEAFVDQDDYGWVKSHFQGVARQVMAIEGAALKAQGFKIVEPVLLSDDVTERTASAALKGAKSKEQVIMMPGVSMDREVSASPKWRIAFRVEKDGEQIVIPSDHYYSIDGLAQRKHDEISSKLLDKRAHDELKDAGGKGARYDSPMALHNHLRWLGGWMLGDEELKTPGELVKKREEIKDRESLD